MRHLLMLCVLLSACSASPDAAPNPCTAAGPEVRQAIERQIQAHVPEACPNCTDVEMGRSGEVLKANPKEAVACLSDILERGYAEAGMWRQPSAAPATTDWVLPLIGHLDPGKGRDLFEREAAREPEPLRSAWAKAHAVLLGNRAYSPELVTFIAALPSPRGEGAVRARTVGSVVLEALSSADYVAALDAIQALQARNYPDPRLAAYEAQFGRDVERLRNLAQPGPAGIAALQALKNMGRADVVKEIASTPAHPLSREAKGILGQERLGTAERSRR